MPVISPPLFSRGCPQFLLPSHVLGCWVLLFQFGLEVSVLQFSGFACCSGNALSTFSCTVTMFKGVSLLHFWWPDLMTLTKECYLSNRIYWQLFPESYLLNLISWLLFIGSHWRCCSCPVDELNWPVDSKKDSSCVLLCEIKAVAPLKEHSFLLYMLCCCFF